jgi:sarcosine oxidase subunit gamma
MADRPNSDQVSELDSAEVRSRGRLRMRRVAVGTQLNVRARPAPAEVAGVRLPVTPNTLVVSGRVRALWLGPDEWLLVDEAGDRALEDRVRGGSSGGAASVVDVSAARMMFEIAGPAARGLLAHGCAIDLHPAVFGIDTCVQTRLALADVVLFAAESADHTDDPAFRVLVRTSFAEYLATWLLDAAAEDVNTPVGGHV